MINSNKITETYGLPQIAGLNPSDSNIEFVGVRDSKTVFWLQNGSNHYFIDLPWKFYTLLKNAYKADVNAVSYLCRITRDITRQVELYTYYMYGEVNDTPDIENGKLAKSENFRDQQDCPSLLWNSKDITIGDHVLTPRQILIIDLIGTDLPDKAIADAMSISTKTLDFHKSNLFRAVGVQTKVALIKIAIQHKVIN
jgi:DNA-binding CsgD family transcriptional regulator